MRAQVVWVLGLLALGCEPEPVERQADAGAVGVEGAALRLVFAQPVAEVVCNGRLFACAAREAECSLDLDAAAEGWGDEVVLCQGVREDAVLAPMVPLVFKDGLPIWTPNLDAEGRVQADPRATALATTFLSPYMTALYPETARALLAQSAESPYLADLVAAVAAGDAESAGEAVMPIVVDVLAQGTLSQELSTASVSLGMEHIEVEQVGGYLSLDARLGTSVDHICVLYALDDCSVESEVALGRLSGAEVFPKSLIGRTFVPAKSYFKLQNLAREALELLFGDLVPMREMDTFRMSPGQLHDIQCYSGALGLADEEDAALDAAFIASEDQGAYFRNVARVTNLVSLATETLKIFVDFDAFGDGNDLAEAVSICTEKALGPSLALLDGTTREEWFVLLKTVQGCAIRRLGVVLAKRGAYAVAAWVLDFAVDGGKGIVGKASRIGMVLDRVAGMVALMSPVQRRLIANEVDFEACVPCQDTCPEAGAITCAGEEGFQVCSMREGCLAWGAEEGCGAGRVCEGDECLDCGGLGDRCCARGTCEPGSACREGLCEAGCREECPADGVRECLDAGRRQICGEHDGDPCLEWRVEACEAGDVCVEGACEAPACEDDCELGASRCGADGVETCGQCDADGCRDWCEPVACEAHFECVEGACDCAEEDALGEHPGQAQPDLDDGGGTTMVEDSLWPEGDLDVFHAYVADTPGNTLLPTASVRDAGPDLIYDLCVAYECDPEENDGDPSSVDCDGAVRTTRDGLPACCALSVQGDAEVSIDINCTPGGLRDDSGTAFVYLEAVEGAQCWRPLRTTLAGGED